MNETRVRAYFQPELQPGEIILWLGQPTLKKIFHPRDWFLVPFSLLWLGFNFSLAPNSDPRFSLEQLIPIFFFLLGNFFAWGRFLYDAYRKTITFYCITNQRILVIHDAFHKHIFERRLEAVDYIERVERKDDYGSLFFNELAAMNFRGLDIRRNDPFLLRLKDLAFIDIPNVRGVYSIIKEKQQAILLQHQSL